MDREEINEEAKATKNTRVVWKWVIGVGIVLMIIAFWGGFFNHDENFSESESPELTNKVVVSDTVASDTAKAIQTDSTP